MVTDSFKIEILPPDTHPQLCTCFLCGQTATRAYLFTGPGKEYSQYMEGIDEGTLERINEIGPGRWNPPLLFETCADCPPTAENFNQKLVARMVAKELEGC